MSYRPSALFVASECSPFAKAGGLGDVVGALPVALREQGCDVRVVIPRYDSIPLEGLVRHEMPLGVPFGHGEAWCAVYEGRLPSSDVPIYFIDYLDFFGRGYLYDPPNGFAQDNFLRYAFLSRAALQLCKALQFIPDVFHVHDWPSALIPLYLNTLERHGPLGSSASVLTIHNIAHPGMFPKEQLPYTHLPWELFRADGLEDHGVINTLKGGLYHATMLTTVSPSYAAEIRTREGGRGLENVLNFRGGDLVGILNGIDERVWNPETDTYIPEHYSADDLAGKAACKAALQEKFGLAVRSDVPLFGLVSRLTDQKGTDVVTQIIPQLVGMGAQLVVLGSGDPRTEKELRMFSHFGRESFRAYIGFNEPLSHLIEAGSDFFLMPSRFEPCGLNQLYSQRYGTLPIVRKTGGLADTVENYNEATGEGTGFVLEQLSPYALLETIRWAIETWRNRPAHFQGMQQRAMKKPMGWNLAAEKYINVYGWALGKRRG